MHDRIPPDPSAGPAPGTPLTPLGRPFALAQRTAPGVCSCPAAARCDAPGRHPRDERWWQAPIPAADLAPRTPRAVVLVHTVVRSWVWTQIPAAWPTGTSARHPRLLPRPRRFR